MRRGGAPVRLAAAALAPAALTAVALLGAPEELPAQEEAAREEAGATAESEPATTLDGVYTAEQARRGEEVFSRRCAACHGTDRFTGPAFVPSWSRAPLSTLFTVIRSQMPFDNPGSLEREAYAAVIAYIFELNGLPAGDRPLPAHADSLREITIRFEPGPDDGPGG